MKNTVIKKIITYNFSLLIILIISIIISLKLGSADISWADILKMDSDVYKTIILQIRLPRILLAGLVGASLAVAGVAFQGVLRNDLADPYIIGTSSGAALGAAVTIMLGIGGLLNNIPLIPVIAFTSSLLTMIIIYQIARVGNKLPTETFLLAGVVMGAFLWALVSFLFIMAKESLPKIIFWMMGTFNYQGWNHILLLIPYFLIAFIFLYILSFRLNIFSLGEEHAAHLGISVEKSKFLVILFATLITSAAVAVSGMIGFVGLMVPHIMRNITGSDHRLLYPVSALSGAVFLIWADNLSRLLISPAEIPVGVITALCGAPFFFYLLKIRKSKIITFK
ncbi:MAG: iron chelate uptake ABC transporter family permease subunit [Armatimonadota bacterium]